MKITSLALIAGAVATLAGCADSGSGPSGTEPQLASVSPINEDELRRYTGLGPGAVAGQAIMARPGGTGASCAGAVVRLVPAITAVRETYEAFNRGQNVTANPNRDIRVTSVRRQTVCDAQGRFHFANLPEGQWVVATEIRGAAGQPGRLLHQLVTVRGGAPTQVALSERDAVNLPNARMAGS